MAKQQVRSAAKGQKKEDRKSEPVYKIRRAKRAVAAAEPVDPAALLREVEQGHRRYRILKERLGASRHGLYVAFSQLRKQGLVTGWDNSMHGELRLAEPK